MRRLDASSISAGGTAAIWTCVSNSPKHQQPQLLAQLATDPLWREPTWAKLISYMMLPAVLTLKGGLEANNYSTVLGGGPLDFMQSGLLETLGPGDVFVWVGVGNLEWHAASNSTSYFAHDVMRTLTARGVLTVFYSTESFLHHSCASKRTLPVREIWEYTRTNVLCCPDDEKAARVRYVPPGYHPRQRLAGSASPAAQHNAPAVPPLKLVFFGSANYWYWMRHQCLRHVTSGLVAGWDAADPKGATTLGAQCLNTICERCNTTRCPMLAAHGAIDDGSWDNVVASNRYFINMHKVCDWAMHASEPTASSNASCESFRLASLLSAGAEVFSEHCHPADEEEYEGLVRFLPMQNLSDEVVATWRANGRRATHAAARERARRFAVRFAPAAIFERAGITEMLLAHRSAAAGTAVQRGRTHSSGGMGDRRSIDSGKPVRPETAAVLRARFPDVPAFCCLAGSECDILHKLTHVKVRGNMTLLLEMQAGSRGRKG